MNRREFVQSLAAISAGVALPVSVQGFQGLINSDLELVEWLEANFVCSFGAAWAYVEPRPAWADGEFDSEDPRWGGLTPYVTMEAEAYDSPAKLLLAEFEALLANHPAARGSPLYWRLPERVKVRETWWQDRGACVLTQEQVEDGGNGWPTPEQAAAMTPAVYTALRSMMDEGADITCPSGCVGSIEEGYISMAVGAPWAVRSVRTRVAIPALQVIVPGIYEASERLSIEGRAYRVGKGDAAQVERARGFRGSM